MTNIWQTAQQHELTYINTKESQLWHMHSLEYWKEFLNLNKIVGQGIEIGCGMNGIYNYTSHILGLDTINFHKSNFIQASAEHLPFKQVDFAILCNSLDHCQNPKQVLNEVNKITTKLIIWTYIYPKLVSFLLSKFDKMHPHHFTENHFIKLTKNYEITSITFSSPLFFSKYTNKRWMKFKLMIMYLLNIRSICIHLVKTNV